MAADFHDVNAAREMNAGMTVVSLEGCLHAENTGHVSSLVQ